MRNYRNSFTYSNNPLPRTVSTSQLYFPNKPIQSSAFSAAHFGTLLTYRSYLLHEAKCIDIQIQRDSAEFNLMIHRLMEAQSILKQQREGLKDQLNARRGQLKVKQDQREIIELANIKSLAHTKQVVQIQQKLAKMNHTLKLQGQSLKKQIKRKSEDREAIIQKMRAKEKDYKQATQNINAKSKQIMIGKQKEKHLHQLEAKLKDEKEIKVKSLIDQSKKYIETADKLRAHEEEKNYLQNVEQILKSKVLQLQNRKIEVGSKLESCRQHRIELQNKQQQLNYTLQMVLTQLEMQQRHRQNEADRIIIEKQRILQNKQRLNKLKSYIAQLKQNNNTIQKVMKSFKKQDEVQMANILLKTKLQNGQLMKNSFDDRNINIKMVDCIGQVEQRQKTEKTVQSYSLDRSRKEFNQTQLQTKSKQNILKGYFKFCNIQHNGDHSNHYSHINEDQIQYTDNILETQSRLTHNPNQNKPQHPTKLEQNPLTFPLFLSTRPSHNCQFKTYRMPEQVSNIVNKFKPSLDSNILQSISQTQTRIQRQGKQNYDINSENKCKLQFLSFGTMFGLKNLYEDHNGGYLGTDWGKRRGVVESSNRVE